MSRACRAKHVCSRRDRFGANVRVMVDLSVTIQTFQVFVVRVPVGNQPLFKRLRTRQLASFDQSHSASSCVPTILTSGSQVSSKFEISTLVCARSSYLSWCFRMIIRAFLSLLSFLYSCLVRFVFDQRDPTLRRCHNKLCFGIRSSVRTI